MKQSFLLILTGVFWVSSKGQSTNDVFRASKGKWHFPIATFEQVDTTVGDCLGGRGNSPYLTLKAGCSQEVRAIQSGEVRAVANVEGVDMVMIKTGEYFLVYVGLTNTQIKKGDKVEQGSIMGTLAKGDDEVTFDLSLMLLNQSKTLNINRWFNWQAAHNSSF